MEYNESYFKNDIREGFFIPGMVKRSWAIQTDVLAAVDAVCKKHGLKWFAAYGTLIGAVRHGGFIPWDDDLDIFMLRRDYEIFSQVASSELPEGYMVINLDNEPEYDNFLTRVTCGNGISTEGEYLKMHRGFPYVAGIDIFPLDNVYDDEVKETERKGRANALRDFSDSIIAGEQSLSEAELIERAQELSGIQGNLTVSFGANIRRMIDAIFKECTDDTTEYVACMPFWTRYGKQRFPRNWYQYALQIPFETGNINITPAYDVLLRECYGNWEVANRQGGIHNYPFYSEQQETLLSVAGNIPYTYHFGTLTDELRTSRKAESLEHQKQSDHIINQLSVVIQALGNPAARSEALLEQCEKILVATCNELEAQGWQFRVDREDMESSAGDILNTYVNEIKPKEVLFLPVHKSDWNTMKRAYHSYNKQNAKIWIMPVPYAHRGDDGNMGDILCEQEAFLADDELKDYILDYRSFDFNHNHFHEIVIQNPYDEYESGETVHPFFYSSNLYKLCNAITYIPYFDLEHIGDNDKKAYANMNACILMPGIECADKIIVHDEEIKEFYLNYLKAHSCSRLPDVEVICGEETDKPVADNRKTLVFYQSFSDYFIDADKAFNKLKSVLDIFEKNSDRLDVIWIQEETFSDNMKKILDDRYNEYMSIEDGFRKSSYGKVRDSEYFKTHIDGFDGFYGSGGYIMNLCVKKHIPTMIRNVDI